MIRSEKPRIAVRPIIVASPSPISEVSSTRCSFLRQIVKRIDGHAVMMDLEMQVRAGRVAASTGNGDDLSLLHLLTIHHEDFSQVGVESLKVVLVINN